MEKYNKQIGKDLYGYLNRNKLLEYGAVFSGNYVREFLEIEFPDIATKKVFSEIVLYELSAIDYVRNILLGNGKYLKGEGGDYRVLLPSENKRQCELYISSANKKLSRSLKLSRSTPQESGGIDIDMKHQTVRAIMAQDSINKQPLKLR